MYDRYAAESRYTNFGEVETLDEIEPVMKDDRHNGPLIKANPEMRVRYRSDAAMMQLRWCISLTLLLACVVSAYAHRRTLRGRYPSFYDSLHSGAPAAPFLLSKDAAFPWESRFADSLLSSNLGFSRAGIRRQRRAGKGFQWRDGALRNVIVIRSEYLTMDTGLGYCTYAFPVFSDDGRHCLAYIECGCSNLGAYRSVCVYRRSDSGWIELKQYAGYHFNMLSF